MNKGLILSSQIQSSRKINGYNVNDIKPSKEEKNQIRKENEYKIRNNNN